MMELWLDREYVADIRQISILDSIDKRLENILAGCQFWVMQSIWLQLPTELRSNEFIRSIRVSATYLCNMSFHLYYLQIKFLVKNAYVSNNFAIINNLKESSVLWRTGKKIFDLFMLNQNLTVWTLQDFWSLSIVQYMLERVRSLAYCRSCYPEMCVRKCFPKNFRPLLVSLLATYFIVFYILSWRPLFL